MVSRIHKPTRSTLMIGPTDASARYAETLHRMQRLADTETHRQHERHRDRPGRDSRRIPREIDVDFLRQHGQDERDCISGKQQLRDRQIEYHFDDSGGGAQADAHGDCAHEHGARESAVGKSLHRRAHCVQRRLGYRRAKPQRRAESDDDENADPVRIERRAAHRREFRKRRRQQAAGFVAEVREPVGEPQIEKQHARHAQRNAVGHDAAIGDGLL